jgi:ectoine hydroxylase-related dioxygenase (phytanoyl-CoA dioxygenase family)
VTLALADDAAVVTAAQAAAFERDGFAHLPALLDPAELAAFVPLVREVAGASSQAQVPMEERGTYQKAFVQEVNLWQRHEAIRPLAFSPRLARAAAELLGVEGVRMYHDQALVKEAGGGHTPWHCDQHYWPIDSDRTVTAWIPLQDVPLEMGPLRFSAGSQRVDLGRALAIGDESDAGVRRHPRWRELPVWEQPIAGGDVTFHQGWTFHGAGPNSTGETRLVFTVIYVADGARLAEPRTDGQRFDRKIWLPEVEVGEPVGSWLNPLVWHEAGDWQHTVADLPPPANQAGTFTLTA